MTLEPGQAVRLARALRDLRESEWPDAALTQAELAGALSVESRVASATLSSWESLTNPRTPAPSRLSGYARFFATLRSLDGGPHLIPESELEPDELDRFHELEEHLFGLLNPGPREQRPPTFAFAEGPVTIICPEAPVDAQGPLARLDNANFTKLQRYADLDALIEIWGHVRASNPDLDDIAHCLSSEVEADHLSSHVILLGGIGWNPAARRFQSALGQLPVTQIAHESVRSGEIFNVKDSDGDRLFFPEWYEPPIDGMQELVEDVALLARLHNPFRVGRTLTICNGIHSRGVYGAVRCLTDRAVRDTNEEYLAERFPEGTFAILLRVPVLDDVTVSPDLQNPDLRLYEWPPQGGGTSQYHPQDRGATAGPWGDRWARHGDGAGSG